MIREKVCLVGCGLMGGSLALALRPFLHHLTVVERDEATLTAVTSLADVVTKDLAKGLRDADLLILATPVRTIIDLLKQLPQLKPTGCMVIDLGSTKQEICEAMAALPEPFAVLGGHPMCGKETAGFAMATPDLYRGQPFIWCRLPQTSSRLEAIASAMVTHMGAVPLWLAPEHHDRLVATTSHLPYLVAATLMQVAAAMADEQVWPVSASGFRDTSRLAGSDPQMMLDILLTNKTAVLAQLAQYQRLLETATAFLRDENEAALQRWLMTAQAQHRAYRSVKG